MQSTEPQKQVQTDVKQVKEVKDSKSEMGQSTNLSEGSLENHDEEFKVEKGEKFEFINEEVKDWPQWTVEQKEKEQQKTLQKTQEVTKPKVEIKRPRFHRGMNFKKRKAMMEEYAAKVKAQKELEAQEAAKIEEPKKAE